MILMFKDLGGELVIVNMDHVLTMEPGEITGRRVVTIHMLNDTVVEVDSYMRDIAQLISTGMVTDTNKFIQVLKD